MVSTLENFKVAPPFAIPPLESRYPPTSLEETRRGMAYLTKKPVLVQPNEIRRRYTDFNLQEMLHASTPQVRLENRLLELPEGEITNWLIGGYRDTPAMRRVWEAFRKYDDTVMVIKGGDVPILSNYLIEKRNGLSARTELDCCPYVLGGTEIQSWDLWKNMGLRDTFEDFTLPRTNPRLYMKKLYDDQNNLIAEIQHPHLNFAWSRLIDDVFLSPLRFLSARIIVANSGDKLRFFLFDPLGGLNDWYEQVRPIARITDPYLLNDQENDGFSWLGNGFPYAVSSIVHANAEVPEETIQFLAKAYAHSRKSAKSRDNWKIVKQGIKTHTDKLFTKLNYIDQEIRFLNLMEQIVSLANVIESSH